MVKLNKVEVGILQDGNAAREYEDRIVETTSNSVTRYVEIKEGQPFVILFARDPDYNSAVYDTFQVTVSIDGRRAGDTILPKGCLRERDGRFTWLIPGFWKMLKGREVLREFQFEEARLRSMRRNESLSELRQQFINQGTICVEVSQCYGSFVTDGDDCLSDAEEEEEDAQSVIPKDVVKEKGSSSKASYNIVERPDTRESTFRITKECDVAKFEFKYRTLEALYDQQIVPRPDQDVATLRAELEALQREHEKLKQNVKKEKAERRAGSSARKRKPIQTLEPGEIELIEERPAHRRKPNTDDVVIELYD